MSTSSTSHQSRFVVTSTVTSTTPTLSQNSVLLDVGEPSTAAINDIEDMNDMNITDYHHHNHRPESPIESDDSNASNMHGDANNQVIFLLFLK